MTVQVAVDIEAIQDAIQDWFSTATELETIWDDQDQPQPPYPYAGLDIISGPRRIGGRDDKINTTDLAKVGEEVEICHIGDRHLVVSCQIHVGPKKDQSGTFQEPAPNCNARALMASADAQLELERTKTLFRNATLAFVRSQDPISLDLPIAGQIVSRVQMDVEFATKSRVVERETFIEDVGITGTFEGAGTPIVEDFSVDNP